MLRSLLFLCVVTVSAFAGETNSILVRTNPAAYSIRSEVSATIDGEATASLVIALPIPPNNPHQDTVNVQWKSEPQTTLTRRVYPETGEPYLSAKFLSPKNRAAVTLTFDTTVYDVAADFSKVKESFAYDKNSETHKRYTRKSGNIVVPDHPKIKETVKELAAKSETPLEFARSAYHYVAENFKYLNPSTGIHPLDKVLTDGGGDCGNLSSVYVSLLRSYGIPARHLVGVRPDGSAHVFADFYLEKYGWIPVDVTYKNINPAGDYFGRLSAKDVPVIVCVDADLTVQGVTAPVNVPMIQLFAYWHHNRSEVSVKCESVFQGVRKDKNKKM